jgi:hypothetical protein
VARTAEHAGRRLTRGSPMRALHLIDSITEITPAMGDAVIVSGSHGGRSAAAFALAVRPAPRAVFFNDAGIGKEVPASSRCRFWNRRASRPLPTAMTRRASAMRWMVFECGVVTALNAEAGAAGWWRGRRWRRPCRCCGRRRRMAGHAGRAEADASSPPCLVRGGIGRVESRTRRIRIRLANGRFQREGTSLPAATRRGQCPLPDFFQGSS